MDVVKQLHVQPPIENQSGKISPNSDCITLQCSPERKVSL